MNQQAVKPDIERQVDSLPDAKALVAYLERCKKELLLTTEMMAQAVARAQREGWDIPEEVLSHSQKSWLMKVANRQVEARLYDQLGSRPRTLRLFSGLPIQDQQRIANDGSIEIVEPDGDKRRVKLLFLESRDLKQLFDSDGSLRSEGAQKHYLKQVASEPRAVRAEADVAKIELDQRSKSLSIRFKDDVVKISKKDLARYLEQLL